MHPYISKHATKRLKERLGLKKKAQQRHMDKVIGKGVIKEYDMLESIFYIYYDYHLYIVEYCSGCNAILVTVFPREKSNYNIKSYNNTNTLLNYHKSA
jgi:hypothetical protein